MKIKNKFSAFLISVSILFAALLITGANRVSGLEKVLRTQSAFATGDCAPI